MKWVIVVVVAYLLWRWYRARSAASAPVYQVGGQGGWAGGYVPFSGGKNGGFTFGLNVPWSQWNQN